MIAKNNSGLSILLSVNQLEYLCASLLKAYRDQVAETSHIHIEGVCDQKDYDLTIMFENFREPLTPEQASKLMNKKF